MAGFRVATDPNFYGRVHGPIKEPEWTDGTICGLKSPVDLISSTPVRRRVELGRVTREMLSKLSFLFKKERSPAFVTRTESDYAAFVIFLPMNHLKRILIRNPLKLTFFLSLALSNWSEFWGGILLTLPEIMRLFADTQQSLSGQAICCIGAFVDPLQRVHFCKAKRVTNQLRFVSKSVILCSRKSSHSVKWFFTVHKYLLTDLGVWKIDVKLFVT